MSNLLIKLAFSVLIHYGYDDMMMMMMIKFITIIIIIIIIIIIVVVVVVVVWPSSLIFSGYLSHVSAASHSLETRYEQYQGWLKTVIIS